MIGTTPPKDLINNGLNYAYYLNLILNVVRQITCLILNAAFEN